MVYGLILRPQVFGEPAFPLEVVFILASTYAIGQLLFLGFSWREIEDAILGNLRTALPAFFVLLTIGLVIGSWMVCGTIPMLVSRRRCSPN